MLLLPTVSFAQSGSDNLNDQRITDARKDKLIADNQPTIKPLTKIVSKDSVVNPKHTLTAIKARRHQFADDKYVPLAGETNYFGKNNEAVIAYTKNYFEKNAHHFVTILNRSRTHFPLIENALGKRDLPSELKYLSVIESALNPRAVSGAGAVGPWQFMASTAQFMGLTVAGKRDDRTDWHKSSNAAAKYLQYLYNQFDDWLLVIAAYNCGPTPVLNAIKKTGSSDFFVIKKHLPRESQNHVMAFIATATIMERLDDYIGRDLPKDFAWNNLAISPANGVNAPAPKKNTIQFKFPEEELKQMAIVRISKPLDLDILAQTISCDRKTLGRWNFDYTTYLYDFAEGITTEPFKLRIPKDKLDTYLENKDIIEKRSSQMSIF